MGKTAKDRYIEENHLYKRVRNKDIDNPFSDEAIAGARKIGIDLGVGGVSGGQQGAGSDSGHVIEVNGKRYKYKGSGPTDSMTSYTEVKK
jgi:hypothetical protein